MHTAAVRFVRRFFDDVLPNELIDLRGDELTCNVHLFRDVANCRKPGLGDEGYHRVLRTGHANIRGIIFAMPRHQRGETQQAVYQMTKLAVSAVLYEGCQGDAERRKAFDRSWLALFPLLVLASPVFSIAARFVVSHRN